MRPTAAVVEPFRRYIELRNGDDGEMVKRDVVLTPASLAYSQGMKIGAILTPTPEWQSIATAVAEGGGRSITVKFGRLDPARHTLRVPCDAVMIGRDLGLWHLLVVSTSEVIFALELNPLGGNFPSLTDDAFRLPR